MQKIWLKLLMYVLQKIHGFYDPKTVFLVQAK